MKFVYFYLLTIIIVREMEVKGSGDFTPDELEYISKRLYPAECLRLMAALSKRSIFKIPCKGYQKFTRDSWDHSWLCCLEKLEDWNDRGQRDRSPHHKLGGILNKMGRADLAAYLEKNVRQKQANKMSKINAKRRKLRQEDKGPRMNDLAFAHNQETMIGKTPVVHEESSPASVESLGPQFTMYAIIASLAILSCLGCIAVLSYRRAYHHYQCYMNHFSSKDEERAIYDEATNRKEEANCTKTVGKSNGKLKSINEATEKKIGDAAGDTLGAAGATVCESVVYTMADTARDETNDEITVEAFAKEISVDDGTCKCSPSTKKPPQSYMETMKRICCCGKMSPQAPKRALEDPQSMCPLAAQPNETSASAQNDKCPCKLKSSQQNPDFPQGVRKTKTKNRRMQSSKRASDPQTKSCMCEMCQLFNLPGSSTDCHSSPEPERRKKKSSPLKRLKKQALKLSPRGYACN